MTKQKLNIKAFHNRGIRKRKAMRTFLQRLDKKRPSNLAWVAKRKQAETWKEVDCLACGNCCRTMVPTWKKAEVQRVADHLGMTYQAFFDRWLTIDADNGDIMNKLTPCQFFNRKDGKCSIYEIRPADCAEFPHLHFKAWMDIEYIYTQNIHRCPATLTMLEKMEEAWKDGEMNKPRT